ncbi:MAG: alpha-isopropylmalate synthase regulatory domain-containing protein, partial [Candidatus Sedimenticola sp. 6PFRAG1]
ITFDSEEELNDAFRRFKDLADKKHEIFDDDLQALVTDAGFSAENERVKLVSVDGEERSAAETGGGPVDAALKSIESIVKCGAELQLYSVNAITSGTDAQGEVTVRLQKEGRIVNGQGADTDIVIASAKAYINAVNKLEQDADKAHPQKGEV